MRTLTPAMQAATAARITRPLHLVQLDSTPPLRFCTLQTLTLMGASWQEAGLQINGLGGDGAPSLVFTDPDGAIATAVLQGLLDDVPVTVWAGDAAALADTDPVIVWQGATDGASIDPAGRATDGASIDPAGRVTLNLSSAPSIALYAPRLFYGPALGMNTMIPAGAVVKVGDKTYTVERK